MYFEYGCRSGSRFTHVDGYILIGLKDLVFAVELGQLIIGDPS